MVYLMTECDTVDGAASVEHVDALRSLLRTLSSVFALLLLSITASPAQVRRGAPCSCCLWGWLAQWWANGGRGRGAHTHYERVKQPVREETCSVSRMLSAAARWCAVTLHEASALLGVLIGSVRSQQLQPPPQPRHPLLPQGFSLSTSSLLIITTARADSCTPAAVHTLALGLIYPGCKEGENFLTQHWEAKLLHTKTIARCPLCKPPSTTAVCFSVRLSLVVHLNNIQRYRCSEQVLFTWK